CESARFRPGEDRRACGGRWESRKFANTNDGSHSGRSNPRDGRLHGPEQVRGKPVDRRAEIWAFGGVRFEMLRGRMMFAPDAGSDTLVAILKEDPDWSRVPVKAQRLLKSCLEKDPKHRLRDIGDASRLFDDAPAHAAPATQLPWAVAGALALALV